jgi:hypothetical protein
MKIQIKSYEISFSFLLEMITIHYIIELKEKKKKRNKKVALLQ